MISKILASVILMALLLTGCSSKVSDPADEQAEMNSVNKKDLCEKGQCPCDSPLGSIAHLSKVTVYSKSEVGCQESCAALGEQITCNNGKWDQPLEDKFFTCQATECNSCEVGTNLVRHGEAIEMYTATEADCNQSCEDLKTVRRCQNGTLTGDANYKETSCSPRQCRCRLPDESGYLSLGGVIDLYSTQEAECGKTCADYKTTRTCTSSGAGATRTFSFSGDASYQYANCKAATGCFCTLPNNLGVIAAGETAKLSSQQFAACGATCSAANEISVKCERGELKNVATGAVIDPATTTHKYKCSVQECKLCQTPDGNFVTEGTRVKFYKESDPSCTSLKCVFIARDRTCKADGTFDGDPAYGQLTCKDRLCMCPLPPPFDFTGTPVNQNKRFYNATVAACGSTCAANEQLKTCTESGSTGNWTYSFNGDPSYQYENCSEPTTCSCKMPNGMPDLTNGKSTDLSAVAITSCGTTCDSVDKISVTCDNGVLRKTSGETMDISANGFKYIYSCKVANCTECLLTGYSSSIPDGASRTLYPKDKLLCGEKIEQFRYTFTCENGVLKRDGTVYNPAQDPTAPTTWYSFISNACPSCPAPWGGSVQEGITVMAYQLMNDVGNNCGTGCKVQERKCTNGVLSGDPAYNRQACNNTCSQEGGGAPPRACLLPWSNSYVTPDSLIPMWSKRTVPCGDSCQNYFKVGKCDMKTGRFDVPLEYIYQSCTELCN
jgi:hypothetical protein